MEKIISPSAEKNGFEDHQETEYRSMSVKPANSAVLAQSDKVIVQSLNCDTSMAVKKEKDDGFAGDEEEGDLQEDRENQVRRNISTLTSRHYAGHVRVFKGILANITLFILTFYFIRNQAVCYIGQNDVNDSNHEDNFGNLLREIVSVL